MSGIIAFVNARLDEDEETARATSRPAWREWYAEPWHDGEFLGDGRPARADLWGVNGAGGFTGQGALPTVMADHIVRHDPARALREVEAKRRLIEEITSRSSQGVAEIYLAVLADTYSDHPDYRQEWAPSGEAVHPA